MSARITWRLLLVQVISTAAVVSAFLILFGIAGWIEGGCSGQC